MNTAQGIDQLVSNYLHWVRSRTFVKNEFSDGLIELATPFVDQYNDFIHLYIKKIEDGKWLLSDGGQTINNLDILGVELDTQRRRDILSSILNGFGVKRIGDTLQIEAHEHDVGYKKHALLQTIVAVGDMFMIGKETVISLFREDVQDLLIQLDVPFSPDITFTGKTGYARYFDFLISGRPSRKIPEKVIKTLNSPSKQSVDTIIMGWQDVAEVRPAGSLLYVVINDENLKKGKTLDALKSYNIRPILFSEKGRFKQELLEAS